MAERGVSDDGNAMTFAPGQDPVLDCSLSNIIEDLIADRPDTTADGPDFFEIRHIEVAHAPTEDFAGTAKLLECRDSALQWVLSPPVQEIAVQSVGLEA